MCELRAQIFLAEWIHRELHSHRTDFVYDVLLFRSHPHFLGNRCAPNSPWGESVLPGKNGYVAGAWAAAGVQVRATGTVPVPRTEFGSWSFVGCVWRPTVTALCGKPNSGPSSPGPTPGDGRNDNYHFGGRSERRLILGCGRSTGSDRGDCACGDRPLLLCAGNRTAGHPAQR